jgi:uncharacterized protein YkwD
VEAVLTPSRRALLAGLAALAAGAAGPRAAEVWIAYEARLRARLADAGGGRFDAPAAQTLLALTNDARAGNGAGPLVWSPDLAETARAHAADLAARAYVEHLSPEGFDPSDRLALVSRRMLGSTSENIAYHRGPTPATAAQLMDLWRKSPGHWKNLNDPRHTHAGFAVARKADRAYAVGLYAHPLGALAADLPFRLQRQADLEHAVAGVAQRVRFEPVSPGDGALRLTDAGRAPAGAYQLYVERPLDPRRYELVPGPVFVWTER